MEITILHGQGHKGSTYHITEMMKENLLDMDRACEIIDNKVIKLNGDRNDNIDRNNSTSISNSTNANFNVNVNTNANTNVSRNSGRDIVHEYFMPKDTPDFCVGCFQCILKSEEQCPHNEKVQEILVSMLHSEIIIIDSPTYCFEMTGQLKTLFDHFGYMWMSHRPRKEMFSKIGIVISTAAGAGATRVTKSMEKQLFWWGVPKIYRLDFKVNASSWETVSDKVKEKITQKIEVTTHEVKSKLGKVKPNFKTKLLFGMLRKMQNTNNWNMIDKEYWQKNNWLEKTRPWR